jgi:hypothetical protein
MLLSQGNRSYIEKACYSKLGMTMNYPNSEQSKAIPFFARFLSADQDEAPTPDSPPILNPLPFGLGNGLLTGKIVN